MPCAPKQERRWPTPHVKREAMNIVKDSTYITRAALAAWLQGEYFHACFIKGSVSFSTTI